MFVLVRAKILKFLAISSRTACKKYGFVDYICVMKKLFTLIVCLACGTVAFAQKTQEFYFSLGLMPYDFMVDDTPYGRDVYAYDLYDAYETQYCNSRYTPLFGLEYHKFLTQRIQLGAGAAYYHSTADLYDPVEDLIVGKRSVNTMYLTAQIR